MNFAFIAIPQKTCGWLLAQENRRHAVASSLSTLSDQESLAAGILAIGPIRIAGIKQHSLLVLWHQDYVTGEGFEHWALLKIAGDCSLLSEPTVVSEVFERFLAVADARLQGLLLDDRFIHRNFGDDIHSCLAGRGEAARHLSLIYSDRSVTFGSSKAPGLVCIGPFGDALEVGVRRLSSDRNRLEELVGLANGFIYSPIRRPSIDSSGFPELRTQFQPTSASALMRHGPVAIIPSLEPVQPTADAATLTYEQWTDSTSSLSEAQRSILNEDVILKQPLRILGPAGSGKTLLLQLLALRRLVAAEKSQESCLILFTVHNQAMAGKVYEQFIDLGADRFLIDKGDRRLKVMTLSEYCSDVLADDEVPVIDIDAAETKRFQLAMVLDKLLDALRHHATVVDDKVAYPFIRQVARNRELQDIFAEILVAEFGIAIKSRGLGTDKEKYVYSEAPLSRLHSLLTTKEREFVFDVFLNYSHYMSEESGLLDPDDLAITMLSRLRTPLWQIKRRKVGYDFVFVDETQLFNENERRLFTLLTKGTKKHVPIILAIDEAQSLSHLSIAGFGTMGIQSLVDESLSTVFRSTISILKLAFFVIQRSTELFGPEFPDFTDKAISVVGDDHKFALPPVLHTGGQLKGPLGKSVVKFASELRNANLRQVAVVVHADRYWDNIVSELKATRHSIFILSTRGQKIAASEALVIITKPEFVGGQEFDAVIAVGLEEGLVPPQVTGQDSLQAGLEQKALREMYVSFTRAKFRLIILNSTGSQPTAVLRDAIVAGVLKNV